MIDEPQDASVPAFKDRKAGLVFFGIIQIAFGAFMGLISLVGVIIETIPVLLALILVPWAVALVWVGIGSIRAHRWARALSFLTAWFWLISGTVALVAAIFFMPDPLSADEAQLWTSTITGYLFWVIVAGVFVLFFRSKHVKATCEFRDPTVRWTDKCPLPVLALSLIFAIGAYFMVLSGVASGWVIPLFGILLRGVPGAAVALVLAALLAYLAWGAYHLEVRAWRGAVALVIFGGMSWIVTSTRISPLDMYEAMNIPEEQLETMGQFMPESWPWLPSVVSLAVWLGYLWYVRRYFESSASHA